MAQKELHAEFEEWRASEKGDTLKGQLVKMVDNERGVQWLVKDPTGNIWTTPAHKNLQDRLKTLTDKQIGAMLTIESRGTVKTKNGEMFLYKAWIDEKPEPESYNEQDAN